MEFGIQKRMGLATRSYKMRVQYYVFNTADKASGTDCQVTQMVEPSLNCGYKAMQQSDGASLKWATRGDASTRYLAPIAHPARASSTLSLLLSTPTDLPRWPPWHSDTGTGVPGWQGCATGADMSFAALAVLDCLPEQSSQYISPLYKLRYGCVFYVGGRGA